MADVEDKIARSLFMSIQKVLTTQARLEQRLAMLRTVEAIRLDAAKNGGKLPSSLADLNVPIPIDPVSGKLFDYKLDGITGRLEGKETTVRQVYEVRLRK